MQAILTPDQSTVAAMSAADSPQSLEAMAGRLAPLVPKWIAGDWAGKAMNVIIVDWFAQARFVEACIAANTASL